MKISNLLLALGFLLALGDATPCDDLHSPMRQWLPRPWEIRYVLFIDDNLGLTSAASVARDLNKETRRVDDGVFFHSDDMLKPTSSFKVPGFTYRIVVVVVKFDETGRASSRDPRMSAFVARRNVLDNLMLVKDDSPYGIPYYLAEWSQGIPGAVDFSPAVCQHNDISRYETKPGEEFLEGGFGCREWTAQLKRWERPYIDVTSYGKSGSFIRKSIGWSRFTDEPKPVIGLHGKTWLCLHECPAGEKPGIIHDIKAWTTKHGFPMPERPPQQPLYPNSKYKADIEED